MKQTVFLFWLCLCGVTGCEFVYRPIETMKPPTEVARKSADLPIKYPQTALELMAKQQGGGTSLVNISEVNLRKSDVTCGPDRGTITMEWEYLHTDEQGDHYQFRVSSPVEAGSDGVRNLEFSIPYTGVEQIVSDEEQYRIRMYPIAPGKGLSAN